MIEAYTCAIIRMRLIHVLVQKFRLIVGYLFFIFFNCGVLEKINKLKGILSPNLNASYSWMNEECVQILKDVVIND